MMEKPGSPPAAHRAVKPRERHRPPALGSSPGLPGLSDRLFDVGIEAVSLVHEGVSLPL